jgi:hypothetical protein
LRSNVPKLSKNIIRTVLQPTKTVLGKAPSPVADDARLNAHFLGDRVLRPAAARRTIRARFTSRWAVLGARQRASA